MNAMSTVDHIDGGRICQMIAKLVDHTKPVDLQLKIAVHCAIGEELLVMRALAKARAA